MDKLKDRIEKEQTLYKSSRRSKNTSENTVSEFMPVKDVDGLGKSQIVAKPERLTSKSPLRLPNSAG